MTKRYIFGILLGAIIMAPFFFPEFVYAWPRARSRGYYENIANRQRLYGNDNCQSIADCLDAAFGRSSTDTFIPGSTIIYWACGPEGCKPQTYGGNALANIELSGYFIGTRRIDPVTIGGVTVDTEVTYFRVELAPRGGPEPEGSGGSGPPPAVVPGLIEVRGRELSSAPASCADVYGAGASNLNMNFSISPQGYPARSQPANNGNYAIWQVYPGTTTVSGVPPANYILKMACWKAVNPNSEGTGLSAPVAQQQTVTWDLGYTNGTSWPQVRGGDVYAFNDISSYIPTTANPRKFLLNGTGNSSAIVTYGNSADFDVDIGGTGGSYVSGTNWLAKDQYPRTDYYQLMYKRFGGPTTVNFTNETITQAQATSSATPYYATGNITTSGNWVIGDGQTLIMLINGNLNIGGKIQTTGTGFVAFIVNGNITVAPSVGSAYNSTTPALEGVYITSPNGVFSTGQSTSSGSERFVGSGIFVAGEFQNQRDLSNVGGTNYNNTYAAELYQYDPQLLITMPKAMKDGNVVWQEVAP